MASVSHGDSGATIRIAYDSPGVSFQAPATFRLELRNGWQSFRDKIALDSLFMYYSWFNITALKGNNIFQYIINGVTRTVVLPDGTYSYVDLQGYLEETMRAFGDFLVDGSGENVYYIKLVANSTFYCISLTCTPLPSVLPENWTNPNAVTLSGDTLQIIVPAGGFAKYIGFNPGTFPTVPQQTVFNLNGSLIPQVTDVTSVNIECNVLGDNPFQASNTIFTFNTSGVKSGSQIKIEPNNLCFYKVSDTHHNNITLSFTDQSGYPLQIRDLSGLTVILKLIKGEKY